MLYNVSTDLHVCLKWINTPTTFCTLIWQGVSNCWIVAACCEKMASNKFGGVFAISSLVPTWLHAKAYLLTLPVFPGVSKFFIKSPGLSECLLGDFRRLFLDIVFNDILTMQRFLDISRILYSGVWQMCKRCLNDVISWLNNNDNRNSHHLGFQQIFQKILILKK